MCVNNLFKNFISPDTLLNFMKDTKYELYICLFSRVNETFCQGAPGFDRDKFQSVKKTWELKFSNWRQFKIPI